MPGISPFIQGGFNKKSLQKFLNILTAGVGGFATGGPGGAVVAAPVRALQIAANPEQKYPVTSRNVITSGAQGAATGAAAAQIGTGLQNFFSPGATSTLTGGGTTTTLAPGSSTQFAPSVAPTAAPTVGLNTHTGNGLNLQALPSQSSA